MIYRFNESEIDTDHYRLLVNGAETPIEPQVFDLIVYLIVNKDKMVTREELLDNIWKGKIVSGTSINNHIKTARKALGDDGKKQHVIKTVHSRGYQFVAVIDTSAGRPRKYGALSLLFLVALVLAILAKEYYQAYKLEQAVQVIASAQEISYTTFVAQMGRRDELAAMIENRIGERRSMQFEKYFSYHASKLNDEEKFVCEQMRAMTDTGLYQSNIKGVFPDLCG